MEIVTLDEDEVNKEESQNEIFYVILLRCTMGPNGSRRTEDLFPKRCWNDLIQTNFTWCGTIVKF